MNLECIRVVIRRQPVGHLELSDLPIEVEDDVVCRWFVAECLHADFANQTRELDSVGQVYNDIRLYILRVMERKIRTNKRLGRDMGNARQMQGQGTQSDRRIG